MVLAESLIHLSTIDLVIFFVTVAVVMAIGLLAARRERSTRDFFLAGRTVRWWAVAGSIFGSNISSHHLVGMTGLGLAAGFAGANYEFGAIVGLLVLCFLFLPIYRRLNVFTLSEYLEKRFDRRSLVVYSAIWIVTLVLIEMVATLFIGSKSLEVLFGIDYRVGIVIVALVTGTYTILGGLKAVIWTDVIQSILLLVGGIAVAWMALSHPVVGGLGGLIEKEPDRFHVFFHLRHKDLPWLGVMTGLMILHLNYWGMNQFIVQRALGAKTTWDGRTGIIAAGFFKLLIPFMTFAAGMAAAHLITAGALPELPEQREGVPHNDMVFPVMMKTLLPTGLVGLALAGLIGAILSTVDSMMNSAATLFTFDFYKRYIRRQAGDRELILVGRIAIGVALIVAGSFAALLYDPEGSFFLHLGNLTSFMAIGVMASFLVGISWKGATRTAAFAVMLAGPVMSVLVVLSWNHAGIHNDWLVNTFSIAEEVRDETGHVRLVTEFSRDDSDALPKVPLVFQPFVETYLSRTYAARPQLNWFYRTFVAFVLCVVLMVLLSWLTRRERRPGDAQLVWSTGGDAQARLDRTGRPRWQDERVWAVVLIVATVILCIKFA